MKASWFGALLGSGQFCGRAERLLERVQATLDAALPAMPDHRLERIGRSEATCSCGRWNARTDEVLQSAITKTLHEMHAAHRAAERK